MKEKSERVLEAKNPYFELQAEMGITKHAGGKKTTMELIELCHVGKDSVVLDVGCGVGKSACFIAEEIGCKVIGVDVTEGMVEKARERAKRKRIEDKVEFRVGDALKLPFKDNSFDAVISESVVAFFKDKEKGMREYVRVARKGGFIGINEVTWNGTPTEKVIEYMKRVMQGEFLSESEWKKLLERAGLKEIKVKVYKPNTLKQLRDEMSWMELRDFIKPWHKVILLFIKSREYRKYIKEMTGAPLSIMKYMGNGIYVGRK